MIETKEVIYGQYMTRFGFIRAGYGAYELRKVLSIQDSNKYIMFIVAMSRMLKRSMK